MHISLTYDTTFCDPPNIRFSLRDVAFMIWSQLKRKLPEITENEMGEVILTWLSEQQKKEMTMSKSDVWNLINLLDFRQCTPDFLTLRLLKHPCVGPHLDSVAHGLISQVVTAEAFWRPTFCPVTRRSFSVAGGPGVPCRATPFCSHFVSTSLLALSWWNLSTRKCPFSCACNSYGQIRSEDMVKDSLAYHMYMAEYYARRKNKRDDPTVLA